MDINCVAINNLLDPKVQNFILIQTNLCRNESGRCDVESPRSSSISWGRRQRWHMDHRLAPEVCFRWFVLRNFQD